jgi:hypothetical protein
MDPIPAIYVFWAVVGLCGTMYCCDKCLCSKCIKKIKATSWIFTPPNTPESNRPPPNSPANSDCSIESHDTLPSPSTMKPDYSSSEDYIDIYIEYHENRRTPSPTNNQGISEV